MEAIMAHIRIRPNGRIQYDLHLYGQRFREGTKLMATPANLKKPMLPSKK
jgi:integrase